ncbi:hypothetical protein COB57_02495 [Candidatus Peregrinibacteria bacterium]|nr:MAG: hypothetical protein COB57_02495 [Candidatus Peregrinibacteria bacterium]
MNTSVSVKYLRQHLSAIADKAEEGETFDVYRRSNFSFKIVPSGSSVDENWETVIDFTENGKRVEIYEALDVLKKMNHPSYRDF